MNKQSEFINEKSDEQIVKENECKPDWCFPSMSKETNELLRQCAELPATEVTVDLDEFIARSKAFPIPFPIETVRVEKLKVRRPIEKLKKNIVSTYPLIHERVLLLMTHFLIYKREFGSSIEKELYKDMSVAQLIDRILKKRAVAFLGQADKYMLISGQEGGGSCICGAETTWADEGELIKHGGGYIFTRKGPLLLNRGGRESDLRSKITSPRIFRNVLFTFRTAF